MDRALTGPRSEITAIIPPSVHIASHCLLNLYLYILVSEALRIHQRCLIVQGMVNINMETHNESKHKEQASGEYSAKDGTFISPPHLLKAQGALEKNRWKDYKSQRSWRTRL